MRIAAAAVLFVLVGASAVARAEDVVAYQADGDADARAPDARVEALDEAFGKAVSQALGELVEPEARKQSKPVLDRELVGHARLWVTKFTVTKESVADDRKLVSVSVRVDRDKLRARLTELNIATRAADGRGEAAASAIAATVLLRVVTPEGVHASYGLSAEKEVAGLAALSSVLRRANMVVKRAPASGPAAKADGDLPVDDDTAEALGAEAKADVVAIASATLGSPVPLRGIDASGVLITARVRLFDRKTHKALGQGAVVTASRGTDPGVVGYALDRALVAAASDVLPQPAQKLPQAQAFTGNDAPIGEPGVVLVRLARSTPWGMVQSEIKHLVGARGVQRATLRHVSPAGWVIGVATGESIDRIASIVKKPPTADTAVSVKIVGDLVEATLSGAP
ncbi:MAG TPA: hypothetical protein VLM79_02130 [Kofleriaceae bacterium]|nr:hypothetical protein [Kofleriaceae bacterium]